MHRLVECPPLVPEYQFCISIKTCWPKVIYFNYVLYILMRIKYLKTYYNAYLQHPSFPNVLVNGASPYDERVMSMPSLLVTTNAPQKVNVSADVQVCNGAYFFFIFNYENYYHFLYDTLPYLHFYYNLSKDNIVKLLVPANHKFLKFQVEILNLLGLSGHLEFAKDNVFYDVLYIPSSLTHGQLLSGGHASNDPYSNECRAIWSRLSTAILLRPVDSEMPKRIYISRRTHLHGDASNIGTNYTTRRRCINEDDVVGVLREYGFAEVFCELLSTEDKIRMFNSATHIVGFIGGGMANSLFSPPSTSVGCIVTPEFLTINSRFRDSMTHADVDFLDITRLAPHLGDHPLYVRIKVTDSDSPYFSKIGEIDAYLPESESYVVKFSTNDIAGFSLSGDFISVQLSSSKFAAIDCGLNSPFICDIDCLRKYLDDKAK